MSETSEDRTAAQSFPGTWRDLRASLIIGFCCLLIYNANGRSISAGDTYPTRYLPFAIWQHHTLVLDPVARLVAQGRGREAFWMQRVRDHEGDVLNGIETNAVTFGPRPTFAASVVLFTLAYAVLLLLALQSIIPRPLAALVVLYPLHLRWSLEALREGLTYAAMRRLRTRYRVLYAVIGLAIVAALR